MQFPHVHFLHCINQWCLTACTVQLQQISTVFMCRQQLPLWWNQIRKLFRLAPQKGNDVNGWMMWFSAERGLLEETECARPTLWTLPLTFPKLSTLLLNLLSDTMVPNKTGCIFTQEKQNACTCARCTATNPVSHITDAEHFTTQLASRYCSAERNWLYLCLNWLIKQHVAC